MSYERKTIDVWWLMVDYGEGWEYEVSVTLTSSILCALVLLRSATSFISLMQTALC